MRWIHFCCGMCQKQHTPHTHQTPIKFVNLRQHPVYWIRIQKELNSLFNEIHVRLWRDYAFKWRKTKILDEGRFWRRIVEGERNPKGVVECIQENFSCHYPSFHFANTSFVVHIWSYTTDGDVWRVCIIRHLFPSSYECTDALFYHYPLLFHQIYSVFVWNVNYDPSFHL